MSRVSSLAILSVLAISACAEPPVTPLPTLTRTGGIASLSEAERQYLLISNSNSLPVDLAASVAAAGGQVTSSMDGIGIAIATSSDPAFATNAGSVKGLQAVVEDMVIEFEQPRIGDEIVAEPSSHGPTGVGSHESFRLAQWAPDAVNAPAAWNAGHLGAGARVAVIDGGIHASHFDLVGQVDVARSRSFTTGAFDTDGGTFWHGTHVAGIIAAKANDFGTIGIAPRATIIGVKVLHNGSGSFASVIAGIVYAATPIAEGGAGAHIINMSLGGGGLKGGAAFAHLLNAVSRATSYAGQRGVLVVAAAGNSAIDLDHTANLVFVPGQSVGVINVSALGPMGWAVPGTAFDLDRPASYTNFGQSAINLAGPGGDFALPGNALCSKPRLPSGSIVTSCWVFDMVLSTSRGAAPSISTYSWAAGTSMASPAVAGVAALIVGKYGPMSPAQLYAKLRDSADDLGKPGNDDFYGRGRVNAGRAVQ